METHPYITKHGLTEQLNLTVEEIQSGQFKDGGIWFPDTKSIICGTFPPRIEYFNRKGYIHYSSNRNKLWKHIDSLYNVNLFANILISEKPDIRIANSKKKIIFLKQKRLGFIDVFTKISRKDNNSSNDNDIIEPFETIFETPIFNDIISSQVENVIFVYSKSYETFVIYLKKYFPGTIISLVREFNKNDISLRVERCTIGKKEIYLSYSPIHGNIKDIYRRPALKKAIERDFI